MKVFSFCCRGLRCLFRLIRGRIFRAFICRVLRLDKTDSVYQDCEDYDTKGNAVFVSVRETLSSSTSS